MRKMQGPSFISRVNFETSKHHRQVFRQQIKPQLFHQLQVSQNPAANYVNAYKSLYKDELQKTMEQHFSKKAKDEHQIMNDKMAYSLNHPLGQSRFCDSKQDNPGQSKMISHEQLLSYCSSLPQIDQKSKIFSSSQVANPGQYDTSSYNPNSSQRQNFRDYFEERTNKFQNHIKNNFDGGQQFFKVQDAYSQKKQKETQNYADFLKKQLQEKEYARMSIREKENMEHMAVKEMQKYQQQLDKQKFMKQLENKTYQNMSQMHELQLERERKQRKSKQFNFNNVSLHNPITNPIEFHIDNPYILKKIQDRTLGC